MNVTVCIPYGQTSQWNHELFCLVKRWWEAEFPEWDVVLGECPQPFNRAHARNSAAIRSRGDIFVFCDADTLPAEADQMAQMAARAYIHPEEWFLPTEYIQLDQGAAEQAIRDRVLPVPTMHNTMNIYRNQPGGWCVIHRDAYFAVGGQDMGFHGWGYEDTAFVDAVSAVVAPAKRRGAAIHLWHPRAQDRASTASLAKNRGRYNLYERAKSNPQRMQKVLVNLGLLEDPDE